MQTNLLSPKTSSPSSVPKSPSSAPTLEEQREQRRRTRNAVFKVVVGIVAVFLVIAGIKAWQIMAMIKGGKAMMAAMPPTTVTSAKVERGNWTAMLNAVGSIAPVQGATIGAELAGTVVEVGFESGTPVEKGAMLIKLDDSAEEAQLRS